MAQRPVIGIDLGGTNMQIGLVSSELKLLAPARRKTKPDEGLEGVLSRIVSGIEEACQAAGLKVTDVGAVGIGAPGAVDPHKGVVLEAVNLRWDNVPLAQILTRKLKVRTFLDNDVNVAVLGENRLGAGKQSSDLLGVWVGTGIGGGLILNGRLFYGHYFSAGEIGHTILFPHLPRGQRSLEHNCSRTAVVERIARLIRSNEKSKLSAEVGDDYGKLKSRTLAKYYRSGAKEDRLIIEVIDHMAVELGIAVANAVTLLSLPRVVLGGGLTEALGAPFVDRVKAAVLAHVFPDACRGVEVVASKLADDAGVYGAAMIALERIRERKP
jgi:glucokinase